MEQRKEQFNKPRHWEQNQDHRNVRNRQQTSNNMNNTLNNTFNRSAYNNSVRYYHQDDQRNRGQHSRGNQLKGNGGKTGNVNYRLNKFNRFCRCKTEASRWKEKVHPSDRFNTEYNLYGQHYRVAPRRQKEDRKKANYNKNKDFTTPNAYYQGQKDSIFVMVIINLLGNIRRQFSKVSLLIKGY